MVKKILIMAGGTGGHVFPALAIAEKLKAQGNTVAFLGTRQGLEAKLVAKHGFPLLTINIAGVRGHKFSRKLVAPLLLLRAVWQAIWVIKAFKPDHVLGMGGFASGPGGLAAWVLRKPLCIHEQNAVAGTTNRYLARLASQVFSAFPGTFDAGIKEMYVGNPIRQSLCQLPTPAQRFERRIGPLQILVIGGSRGAMSLNICVPQALLLLKKPITVWHQAGDQHYAQAEQAYKECQINAKVEPFIDDIARAYAWADLIICRAGAMTVSEIAAVGVAAIFVPFPHAIDDHQAKNAEFLVAVHAAELIRQKAITASKLAGLIDDLLERQHLLSMAEKAYELRRIDAVDKVVAGLHAN